MPRLIIAAIILLATAAILYPLRPHTPLSNKTSSANPLLATAATSEATAPSADPTPPLRTKSQTRVVHRKPTLEETTDLLRNTIIPLAEMPEQSAVDTVAALNRLIRQAGVEPHQLKVICSRSVRELKGKFGGLRVRNAPIAVVLKYVCGSTVMRYRVSEGVVELYSHLDEDPDNDPVPDTPAGKPPEPYDPDDPFAVPPPDASNKEAADPDDPFGPMQPGEEDPFAAPARR